MNYGRMALWMLLLASLAACTRHAGEAAPSAAAAAPPPEACLGGTGPRSGGRSAPHAVPG